MNTSTKYFIETGYSSLTKHGEELCGDNVEILKTEDNVVAVLADGLGSGVKANILSKMTAKIVVTMLEKGATLEEVVETITDSLPLCQKRNLAYSTFTIIQINRDGATYVVEFDNPAIFYLQSGKITPVQSEEVEICGKRIKESRFLMKPGDALVAVSDGVIHAGIGEVLNLGWQWDNVAEYLQRISKTKGTAEDICRWLLTTCEQLYAGKPGDDVTVLTLQLRKPRTLTVAVGPPHDQNDDPKLVEMIMQETGKKVVCGGTTSTIVSKQLGREIEVDINTIDPVIPPTGRLRGIDLVTEGIITLSKTLEYLKNDQDGSEIFSKDNGATLLARVLLDSDQIKFIVGRAINPAHQNPELPLDLGLKLQIVNEITELLKSKGKEVTLHYF
ncbi:MAG TPA: PP2C family protein-serine/threonine phosphatase [Bacillota bacterium]|jgi:hypothetical protein|nr:PP2C family protein-serine/threonine phosphatase [Bacillota bacterium]HOL09613.1 PP2C family protein-serine/threonine phosphatase [Bacillota bacterium]HPO97608.1 PP2C family protein-serine/threonine phosphatase [Bacillota bacterium]